MLDLLERLCNLDGTSGAEDSVRNFIISQIDGLVDWETDNLGNIIAFKKGDKTPNKKLMIDAHMDEVGFIITNITADGFLKFSVVGGIETSALMFRNVRIENKINGVIGGKPIHLISASARKKMPETDSLYIDIGAKSKNEAEEFVSIGDCGVICGDFIKTEDNIISKALDDRIGCAVLIKLLKEKSEYDFYASFSVQEEIGCRGAKVTAFSINPDSAIILEGTTAADISGTPDDKKVCKSGEGVAVSFMDKATVYDREYYDMAMNSGIRCQPKAFVSGGNNSAAVHLSREGVRTIALSAPCRYIHTANSVVNIGDIENMYNLTKYMIKDILK